MMDRALGAIVSSSTAPNNNIEAVNRFGMHYQWGRKDPFTPTSTTINSEVQIYEADGTAITKGSNGIGSSDEQFKLDNTTTTTINHLIQNPSTYYAREIVKDNRVPIASTGDLKSDWWNPVTKTLYDPCPNGYRIPESGTFGKASNWTISTWSGSVLTEGHTFNNGENSFFPASGLRLHSNGKFSQVGTGGHSWISPPYNSTRGHCLNFNSGTIHLNSNNPHAYGFPVRCIRD